MRQSHENNLFYINLYIFTFAVKLNDTKTFTLFPIHRNICLVTILSVMVINMAISQDDKQCGVKFTPWYHNSAGAVSVTFDDADMTQYITAFPVLEKHHMKGTFSVVGEWVSDEPGYTAEPGFFEINRMGWTQLLEMASLGHELAAHGFYHVKYDKQLPVEELAGQMEQIRNLIESKTGRPVFTLFYPYSYASGNIPLAAGKAGYLFGRTGLDTLNPASPPDMYLLASMAILNASAPDSALFRQWLSEAKDNWLVLMYHHLFPQDSKEMEILNAHEVINNYSVTPEVFERQMNDLAATGYWVATISEIGRYITERDNTEIKVLRSKKKVGIYTLNNLDRNIYNIPLTLEIGLPWKKAGVEGSLGDGIYEVKNGRIYVDVVPEQELIITKE